MSKKRSNFNPKYISLAVSDHFFDISQDQLSGDTLNEWVKKSEVDSGARAGIPMEMVVKMKAQERENRELRQANEILRKASAYILPRRSSTAH